MKAIITLVLITISFGLSAQNNDGYYGDKFLISLEFLPQIPLTNNLVRKKADYLKYNKDLSEGQDWFNYGFRFSAGYIARKNVIIKYETGIDFSDIYLNKFVRIPGYDAHITKIPRVSVLTTQFMPVIEFASKKALLPMGFSNQIGIGLSLSRPIEKLYKAKALVSLDVDESTTLEVDPAYMNKHFYDHEHAKPVKTLTLMYALSMRTPLSRHLMFNYGVRYTLNFTLKGNINGDQDYILKEENFADLLSKQQILSLMRLNLGFSWVY